VSIPLAVIEAIVDGPGVALRIEMLLPAGVRHRQLRVRTLILGMLLALADRRPAFLTEVHAALTALPEADQVRLGVIDDWETGPHLLTYRQVERTYGLVSKALSKDQPGGAPSAILTRICDDLLEASIPPEHTRTPAPRWPWTGPTWRPSPARRMILTPCRLDPARALVTVLTRMPAAGITLGDILGDSGYAHRDAEARAIPLRRAGAQLIQDLHPHDRGPQGTHHGAIITNGNLYCPATPTPLLQLGPLPRDATPEDTAAHDARAAELSRHKLGKITSDDADGYHRVSCPAAMGKIRCPLRPASMTLDRGRPEILTPPQHPPACCDQQTITVPPQVAAKTRQKHDYPSPQHRRSYARRTGSERTFSTIKDPATTTIARGWCRLTGTTALTLWLACLLAVRNQRILHTYRARQARNARRAAAGLPPTTRKRRRKTLTMPAAAPP
jgi:hypothetical protein